MTRQIQQLCLCVFFEGTLFDKFPSEDPEKNHPAWGNPSRPSYDLSGFTAWAMCA